MITPKRLAQDVSLVLLGLLVALFAAEWSLRAFWPQRSFVTVGMFEPDPDAGYRLQRGYRSDVRVPEYRTRILTDAEGYRVPVDDPPASPGASRILAIGDSFTFGVGVEAKYAFPEVLDRDLDTEWPGAWTVRNGGVGGYGPLRTAHYLFASQAEWRPDVVVHLLYLGNDLEDPRPLTFRTDPVVRDGRMVTRGEHPLYRLRLFLRAKSHLYSFVRQHAYGLYLASGLAKHSQYLDPMGLREWPPRVVNESWPAGQDAIESIRDWCHANGARYLVVLAPTRWQVDEDSWNRYRADWEREDDAFERDHAQRVVRTELIEAGVEVLDLLPEMREATAGGERLYFRRDVHWTRHGHRVAARAVQARLEKLGWVAAGGDPRRAVARSGDGTPASR
ncbi:hypothetical protein K8I85_15380 [bacterium]|nr:hypothetical protein [bacterium]